MGCASAPPPPADPSQALRRQIETLRESGEDARLRAEELESQLALARAEVRDLRDELDGAPAPEVVRIGATSGDDEGWQEPAQSELVEVNAPEPSEPSGPRPVLRLYGTRVDDDLAALPFAGGEGPALPVAPVAALPDAPAQGPGLGPILTSVQSQPRPARPAQTSGDSGYRQALQLVRDRRFDEALVALNSFLREHPRHPYVPNATYWRGEVHYARRAYREALQEFQRMIDRFPEGAKVPDALLKIALCHRRMGQAAHASRVFERLHRDHPGSVAARMAAQEESR
ncbi:MAG: tol-pal system protein YbgF [Myxococcota bacterium]